MGSIVLVVASRRQIAPNACSLTMLISELPSARIVYENHVVLHTTRLPFTKPAISPLRPPAIAQLHIHTPCAYHNSAPIWRRHDRLKLSGRSPGGAGIVSTRRVAVCRRSSTARTDSHRLASPPAASHPNATGESTLVGFRTAAAPGKSSRILERHAFVIPARATAASACVRRWGAFVAGGMFAFGAARRSALAGPRSQSPHVA